jgi:hypothetical protein
MLRRADRRKRELSSAFDVKLPKDCRQMRLDGLLTNAEFVGNTFILLAGSDERGDLAFARA